jgi:hypothetical protein
MSSNYRNNHYIPQWYQRHFIPPEKTHKELYLLRKQTETFKTPDGIDRPKPTESLEPTKHCFSEQDLYTASFRGMADTDIEQYFFGEVDDRGKRAVAFFEDYDPKEEKKEHFHHFLTFLCTQRFRTPRGLKSLASVNSQASKDTVLAMMIGFQKLYGAIWTECIWQIADAYQSPTKFIISDNPVTFYNRACSPEWLAGRGLGDPDLLWNGTHTLYPLSSEKILLLTHLSWVRNPYGDAVASRPNPALHRDTIFWWEKIQTHRSLTEIEVLQINFIMKCRAERFIAAGTSEWLYPERRIDLNEWATFGHGYLLMPEPRAVSFSREMLIGFKDGRSVGIDEYGRRPGHPDYKNEALATAERETFHRFQGEFARLHGPKRRGRRFEISRLSSEEDEPTYHAYHLSLEKQNSV